MILRRQHNAGGCRLLENILGRFKVSKLIPSASFVASSVIGSTEYISNALRIGGRVASGVAISETVCCLDPSTILFTSSAERYFGV
jgi:hypothetical protein